MSDHLTLEFDSFPWAPSASARLIEELDHWNRPTLGVLEEHGAHYLFRVIYNTDSSVDLWAYTMLSDQELRALDDAATPSALDDVVKHAFEGRPWLVALAGPDSKIVAASVIGPVADGSEAALADAGWQALAARTGYVLGEMQEAGAKALDGSMTSELMKL